MTPLKYLCSTRSFLALKFEFKFELQLSQPYPVLNLKLLIQKSIHGRWLYTWTTNEHAPARDDKSGVVGGNFSIFLFYLFLYILRLFLLLYYIFNYLFNVVLVYFKS